MQAFDDESRSLSERAPAAEPAEPAAPQAPAAGLGGHGGARSWGHEEFAEAAKTRNGLIAIELGKRPAVACANCARGDACLRHRKMPAMPQTRDDASRPALWC